MIIATQSAVAEFIAIATLQAIAVLTIVWNGMNLTRKLWRGVRGEM